VLKLSLLLVVLIANFGDVIKLFIAILFYFKENVVGYLPNCFPHVLK